MSQLKIKDGTLVSNKKILHSDGFMIIEPHKNKIIFRFENNEIKNMINIPFNKDLNTYIIPDLILSKYELNGSEYNWDTKNSFIVNAKCQGNIPKIQKDNNIERNNENTLQNRIEKLESFHLELLNLIKKYN